MLPMLLLGLAANAAEVTEFPPALRGDVGIRYDWDAQQARLMEDGTQVGSRRMAEHRLTYEAEFSFYKAFSLGLSLPHRVAERVNYSDAQEMIFDPSVDAGTMLNTDGIDSPTSLEGKGAGGLWVTLSGAPLHESLFASRGDTVSWVVDLGYRFQDKTNFWTYGPRGTRGAGPGAPAFKLRNSWSKTIRNSQPYLVADLTRTGRINTNVHDADGKQIATGVELQPESTADITLGLELLAARWGVEQQAGNMTVDFRARFGYRSWEDIPSGTYLPHVLQSSEGLVATRSDGVYARGGVGMNFRIMEYVQFNIGGEVGVDGPRQVEHFYPVTSGLGDIAWGLHTGLRFRARDPLFDGVEPTTIDG